MKEKILLETEPKKHRPGAAFCFAAMGLVFYALSLGAMSTVHYIVISVGFGAIVLSIVWFAVAALFMELAYEFHARRTDKRTVSIIAAVLTLYAGGITTGGLALWLAFRLPHSEGAFFFVHALFVSVWATIAVVLFGTALHVIECHTPRKENEDQTERLSTSSA